MAAVASRGSTASAADEASNPGHDRASGYVAAAYAQEKGCKGTPGSQAAREQQERAPAKPAKGVTRMASLLNHAGNRLWRWRPPLSKLDAKFTGLIFDTGSRSFWGSSTDARNSRGRRSAESGVSSCAVSPAIPWFR